MGPGVWKLKAPPGSVERKQRGHERTRKENKKKKELLPLLFIFKNLVVSFMTPPSEASPIFRPLKECVREGAWILCLSYI